MVVGSTGLDGPLKRDEFNRLNTSEPTIDFQGTKC